MLVEAKRISRVLLGGEEVVGEEVLVALLGARVDAWDVDGALGVRAGEGAVADERPLEVGEVAGDGHDAHVADAEAHGRVRRIGCPATGVDGGLRGDFGGCGHVELLG